LVFVSESNDHSPLLLWSTTPFRKTRRCKRPACNAFSACPRVCVKYSSDCAIGYPRKLLDSWHVYGCHDQGQGPPIAAHDGRARDEGRSSPGVARLRVHSQSGGYAEAQSRGCRAAHLGKQLAARQAGDTWQGTALHAVLMFHSVSSMTRLDFTYGTCY
jgi:hypothetical protein